MHLIPENLKGDLNVAQILENVDMDLFEQINDYMKTMILNAIFGDSSPLVKMLMELVDSSEVSS